jgi:hypothetical protein
MELIPAIELTGEGQADENGFWAVFQFAGPDHRLGANNQSQLSLPSRGTIRVELDLAALGWAKKTSAVWPERSLTTVVPAGTYSLVASATGEKGRYMTSRPVRWVAP